MASQGKKVATRGKSQQGSIGMSWQGEPGFLMAGLVRRVAVCSGRSRSGKAGGAGSGEAWYGVAPYGKARHRMAGGVWRGVVGRSMAWQHAAGSARWGQARSGAAGQGNTWRARQVGTRRRVSRHGAAAGARFRWQGKVGLVTAGGAGCGFTRHGTPWCGLVRSGSRGWVRSGLSKRGVVWHGGLDTAYWPLHLTLRRDSWVASDSQHQKMQATWT